MWETLFWNDRVDRVYDHGAENVPGLLPRSPAEVQPDGTLFLPPSAPRPGPYAVASTGMTLLGDKVKSVKEQGLPQEGLILWRLDQFAANLDPDDRITAERRHWRDRHGSAACVQLQARHLQAHHDRHQPQTVEIR